MAFKNVRNLLLINHNDGFIDEFVVLYELSASKNLDFPYDLYGQFDLEELDESESFAEFRFEKRDIRILKEALQIPDMITCSQRSVCDGLGLYAVQAAFIPMQIWRHDPWPSIGSLNWFLLTGHGFGSFWKQSHFSLLKFAKLLNFWLPLFRK